MSIAISSSDLASLSIQIRPGAAHELQVSLAALTESKTLAELSSGYKVHPGQISSKPSAAAQA